MVKLTILQDLDDKNSESKKGEFTKFFITKQRITSSKSTIETLEKIVKYV